MFTSFNSLAVYTAHSLEEQARMRQFLDQLGVEHSVSTMDINAPKGFYPALSPELLQTQTIDYIFYVYKKDYENAKSQIESNWHWVEEA
ncbi:hypothetical protein [Anaerotignum sp.]|uniref:hypothetical protein n=1 Tax=Anaerotignum sp. TaxID=2039241 RepID=UPI003326C738